MTTAMKTGRKDIRDSGLSCHLRSAATDRQGGSMRAKATIGVMALVFAVSAGRAIVNADHDRPGEISEGDESRVQTGFNYAKQQGIKLDLRHKDRGLVGLGSYLVNA